MSIEAMKQWLKSLQWAMHIYQGVSPPHLIESVLSLEKAIAEESLSKAATQEPIGYLEINDIESQREYPHNCRSINLWYEGGEGLAAVYTHAQPKAEQEPKRQPLTDEQITKIWEQRPYFNDFARAIEAAHGITKEQA